MISHPFRFTALAAAVLVLGTSLAAQGRGPGFGPGFASGRGLRALHLTEAQQTQVKAIHERHQSAIQAKVEAAQAAHQALREAMASASTDAKTLQALHEKASAAQFAVMLEHRAVRQEIVPLLTPEQKAQFEKMPQGPGMGRGAGMGPRHGRGPGAGPGMNPDCPMAQ
ncbi:MAG TPA: Spy/CpxP family protein refolding chaperone [Geothrix sp.]|uniref:Spy/CpxP family protein refolding chaperone n=1 Tax=Geothrix mesophila TaxID=2922723 RepID=UPI001FAC2B8B|nr:Spy/CpxP family protein refolding chaperone [Geothrix sp. SG198]HJV37735.1 Spy/CpxP family protein refolding chaperone [Geothrix sp.]